MIIRAGESTVRDWGGACGQDTLHAWQLGRMARAYRSLDVPGRAREQYDVVRYVMQHDRGIRCI